MNKHKLQRVILLGPQGSGKSTQSIIIGRYLKIREISSGQILRQYLRGNSDLSRELKAYITPGLLVPDDLVIRLIVHRLKNKLYKNGFMLDGFPRNIHQAKVLDKNFKIDMVFNLQISNQEALKRLSGRLVCKHGHIWHVKHKKPKKKNICDKCGLPLYVRADDTGVAIRKRLSIYRKKTEKLLKYYKVQNKLVVFDGEKSIKKVSQDILKYLKQNA